ncbi:MAG: hypothetical protein EBT68_06035 [Verrucomicrobia bacterium]|nr:hypothetical protein [Verrucomicrobiota bacterium]
MNFLWGNSIALSWMWGLGLFFSVQFSLQYGLFGLLTFAIPNALGLMIFGGLTQLIAKRAGNGPDALGAFFANWSRPYRLVFFLYQILAVTLTIFALVRYGWQPLGLEPSGLYLLLTILVILAAATLFGEEFDIRRIKFSHGVLGVIALVAAALILVQLPSIGSGQPMMTGVNPFMGLNFWGYAIPICVGLTLGPWLDLQQWQRAIQIQREGKSPLLSYLCGGSLFFLLLLAHGSLALWVSGQLGAAPMRQGIDGLAYGQDGVTRFFWGVASLHPWAFGAYVVALFIMTLTTLDSGYIALRWHLSKSGGAGRPFPLSLLPEGLLASPVPAFVFAVHPGRGLFAAGTGIFHDLLRHVFRGVCGPGVGARLPYRAGQRLAPGEDVLRGQRGGGDFCLRLFPFQPVGHDPGLRSAGGLCGLDVAQARFRPRVRRGCRGTGRNRGQAPRGTGDARGGGGESGIRAGGALFRERSRGGPRPVWPF